MSSSFGVGIGSPTPLNVFGCGCVAATRSGSGETSGAAVGLALEPVLHQPAVVRVDGPQFRECRVSGGQ